MSLFPPLNIDLLKFFKTGQFDCIKLGQTKELILNNCPPPDDYGIGVTIKDALIWYYGGIELHFNKLRQLFLIYSDDLKYIKSTNAIKIDKWILSSNRVLTLQSVIRHLNNEKIDFTKHTNNHFVDEPFIELVLQKSEIKLKFLSVDEKGAVTNPNLYRLFSFSIMKNEISPHILQ